MSKLALSLSGQTVALIFTLSLNCEGCCSPFLARPGRGKLGGAGGPVLKEIHWVRGQPRGKCRGGTSAARVAWRKGRLTSNLL